MVSTHSNALFYVKTVRLILILLYFSGDLGHLPALEEVDQLSVGQEVGVTLLDVQDVGEVHAEEGDAGRIDRPQLLLVFLEVVVRPALLQGLPVLLRQTLQKTKISLHASGRRSTRALPRT